ncbi:MAG: DUF433 domain-containing protein [Myxococcota bacterium]
MQLERYLERDDDGGWWIRGTRVDLATVVEAYRQGLSAEEIAYNYPSAGLEAMYAALTFYLANQERLDAEFRRSEQLLEDRRARVAPAPVIQRLRALAAGRREPAAR